MSRSKPILVQLEMQGRLTLALLPFVAALPFVDDEVLVRVFGQTMSTLNWTRTIASAMKMLQVPLDVIMPELQARKKVPRSKEEQRDYWREAKRAERMRKRSSHAN